MAVIFQARDLNQRGRAILDASRRGVARIRDKDGMSLLVIPEDRVRILEELSEYAGNLIAVETLFEASRSPDRPSLAMTDWPWLAALDDDDLAEFVGDVRRELLRCLKEGTVDGVRQVVDEWRTTAHQLADPTRRRILLGVFDPADYVEARRFVT